MAWLPPGPAAPSNPPPAEWYGWLELAAHSSRDCQGGDDAFWSSVAAACTAVWSNRPADWSRAQRAAAAAPVRVLSGDCLTLAAAGLRTRLLRAHYLDSRPLRILPPSSDRTACPVAITTVTSMYEVYDPHLDEVTGPACGSVAGGWSMSVSGQGLGDVDRISIGGINMSTDSYDVYPDTIDIDEVPPAASGAPGTVDVAVTVAGRTYVSNAHTGQVNYVGDPAECQPPGDLPTKP